MLVVVALGQGIDMAPKGACVGDQQLVAPGVVCAVCVLVRLPYGCSGEIGVQRDLGVQGQMPRSRQVDDDIGPAPGCVPARGGARASPYDSADRALLDEVDMRHHSRDLEHSCQLDLSPYAAGRARAQSPLECRGGPPELPIGLGVDSQLLGEGGVLGCALALHGLYSGAHGFHPGAHLLQLRAHGCQRA